MPASHKRIQAARLWRRMASCAAAASRRPASQSAPQPWRFHKEMKPAGSRAPLHGIRKTKWHYAVACRRGLEPAVAGTGVAVLFALACGPPMGMRMSWSSMLPLPWRGRQAGPVGGLADRIRRHNCPRCTQAPRFGWHAAQCLGLFA